MDAPVSRSRRAAPAFNAEARIEPFKFTGSGSEYFRIWIVNLLLTILTLGIYSAWAKVRRLRYFHGNTTLAGSSFEYHGQPLQILKGRLIAVAVLIPYFLVAWFFPPWDALFILLFFVLTPFLIVRSRLFTSRMTSWRNIRFDFVGGYGRAAGVYIGLMLLMIVTFGLIFPYWTWARTTFSHRPDALRLDAVGLSRPRTRVLHRVAAWRCHHRRRACTGDARHGAAHGWHRAGRRADG